MYNIFLNDIFRATNLLGRIYVIVFVCIYILWPQIMRANAQPQHATLTFNASIYEFEVRINIHIYGKVRWDSAT